MDQLTRDTGEAPEITITTVGGDLSLSGWEQNQFQAEADDEHSLRADQKNGGLTFTCPADCTVRVPRKSHLKIVHVGGDARVKSVEGPVEIQTVGGDLVLRQTGVADLGTVAGDVRAKKINGSLRLKSAGGDVSARGVAGEFSAGTLSADLYLRDVSAGASARVRGNIILNLAFTPGRDYAFEASGDILCRVPPGTSANLSLQSSGDISVDVPGAQIEGDASHKVVTLGGGAANVTLRAAGDISVASLSTDPEAMGDFGEHFGEEFGVMAEEFAAQIESQIEAQMADLEKQLKERLGHPDLHLGAGRVNAEDIAARARRAAERVKEAATRGAKAAQRRAERQARAAEHRAEAAARRKARFQASLNFGDMPRPPKSPAPPVEPVTDEERLAILHMVERGQISVDEAEKLLAALEGNA